MRNQTLKKGIVFTILFLLFLTSTSNAKSFKQKATIKEPLLIQKKTYQNWCSVSGHELLKTYKTNYIAKLSDGNHKQYASIRFLAIDYDAIKSRIKEVLVVDAKTQKFIDATMAYYVVNSKAKTKYSKFSKIAFANESDAKEFMKKYGGKIRDFEFTLYLATRDIQLDSEHFEELQSKLYHKGHKVYTKKCNEIDVKQYEMMLELKSTIVTKKLCKKLSKRDLQNVTRYLWDRKRLDKKANSSHMIFVPKDAKCPVCGMFVAKYPKWAAKFEGHQTHYFDGVKDMMKFIFANEIKAELVQPEVTDYYTISGIKALEAFYVVGSNVYGPMGNELIPFSTIKKAKKFATNHGGEIYKFQEITKEIVDSLDR
jgi:nitrous oxide reductase accessory protein NosL